MTEETSKIVRLNLVGSNLTLAKQQAIIEVIKGYRRGCDALAKEQWSIFFKTGYFNRMHDKDKVTFKRHMGTSVRVQSGRFEVVRMLKSFVSNCGNDYLELIKVSSLHDRVQHQLFYINQRKAWFTREELSMLDGTIIPKEVRKLARTIMRRVLSTRKWPSFKKCAMFLDSRSAEIQTPTNAFQRGKVAAWAFVATMKRRQRILIPLLHNEHYSKRFGETIQGLYFDEKDGKLSFRVMTDVTAHYEETREGYYGDGAIGLSFGLEHLFGTSAGEMLGRCWLRDLKKYDQKLQGISQFCKRSGQNLRENSGYQKLKVTVEGYIKTEIGRTMNKVLNEGKPRELSIQCIALSHPALSQRMNDIIQNAGRKFFTLKLQDIKQKHGIRVSEVSANYIRETCSCCGYVDDRNCLTSTKFHCLLCGHTKHSDINAAANAKARRAWPSGWLYLKKSVVLRYLLREFAERVSGHMFRRTGREDAPTDAISTSPLFEGFDELLKLPADRKKRRSQNTDTSVSVD